MTDPQAKYYDNQDILDVDIDDLYDKSLVQIDKYFRSHFNAIAPNAQELNTPEYQESRCHAFYRKIGFPVVNRQDRSFYSPGFDPNLNTDVNSQNAYASIAANILKDRDFITNQLNIREFDTYKFYRSIFLQGGTNSSAIAIGSMFIRSYDKQFDDSIGPLDFDVSQTQVVDARNQEIKRFFAAQIATMSSSDQQSFIDNLKSRHYIKPFVVDPRFDGNIHPANHTVCAPFLNDKSQTRIYDTTRQNSTAGQLKRPMIETIISVRFNVNNVVLSSQQNNSFVQSIIDFIKSDSSITDQDLVDISNNQLSKLYQSELVIFNKYIRVIRALVKKLHVAVSKLGYIRKHINWIPVPNTNSGVEVGSEGGSIVSPPDPTDRNNLEIENNIIDLINKKTMAEVSFNIGLDSTVDPGNFAFSNIDDLVSGDYNNVKTSYQSQLDKLNAFRNRKGNDGLDLLKEIEIITGEFGGLGLLDIMAIQAALWIMNPNALIGLIDSRALIRASSRKDLNFDSASQMDIISSLTELEKNVKQLYKIIGKYIGDINSNGLTTAA